VVKYKMTIMKKKPLFYGFKKGEKLFEKQGTYVLIGEGTDLGCNLVLQEDIPNPSILEMEIRGEIEKEAPWSRLRVEIFDRSNLEVAATSYEDEYLTLDLSPDHFKKHSFPILGIVKYPHRIQFMVVGPAKSRLEIKNILLR